MKIQNTFSTYYHCQDKGISSPEGVWIHKAGVNFLRPEDLDGFGQSVKKTREGKS